MTGITMSLPNKGFPIPIGADKELLRSAQSWANLSYWSCQLTPWEHVLIGS